MGSRRRRRFERSLSLGIGRQSASYLSGGAGGRSFAGAYGRGAATRGRDWRRFGSKLAGGSPWVPGGAALGFGRAGRRGAMADVVVETSGERPRLSWGA